MSKMIFHSVLPSIVESSIAASLVSSEGSLTASDDKAVSIRVPASISAQAQGISQ